MTPTEGKYWRDWRAICRAKSWKQSDSRLRHSMHKMALGENKSHMAFTRADWDRVFNIMKTLANSCDLDAQIERIAYEQHDEAQATHRPVVRAGKGRARSTPSRYEEMTGEDDPGERRRLNYALRIFGPALIANICRDRFDTADTTALSIPQLTELRDLLNNRFYIWLGKITDEHLQPLCPFSIFNQKTGRRLSKKKLRAEFMRCAVAASMSPTPDLELETVEDPF